MVDRAEKALDRLTDKERKQIKIVLSKLELRATSHFDIKKLKGRDDIYRVRKGRLRIIYRIDGNGDVFLLAIERRSDTTYNFM